MFTTVDMILLLAFVGSLVAIPIFNVSGFLTIILMLCAGVSIFILCDNRD